MIQIRKKSEFYKIVQSLSGALILVAAVLSQNLIFVYLISHQLGFVQS